MSDKLDHQKQIYDKRAHGEPFEPGDLVWLHSLAVLRGKSRKLHCPWTGPFRVVRRLSDAVYRIKHSRTPHKRLVVHFDRLKKCSPNTEPPVADTAQYRPPRHLPPAPSPVGDELELMDGDPGVLPRQSHDGALPTRPSAPAQDGALPTRPSTPAPLEAERPLHLSRPPVLPTSHHNHTPPGTPDGLGHSQTDSAQPINIEFETNSSEEGAV